MDIIEAVNMLSSFLLMASLCIELQIYAINFPCAEAYFSENSEFWNSISFHNKELTLQRFFRENHLPYAMKMNGQFT